VQVVLISAIDPYPRDLAEAQRPVACHVDRAIDLRRIADLGALRSRFVEEGVFIRPIGNIIYLTPAFTITQDELAVLTDAVVKVVG